MDQSHAIRSMARKPKKRRTKDNQPKNTSITTPTSIRAMTSEPASKRTLSLPSFSSKTDDSTNRNVVQKQAVMEKVKEPVTQKLVSKTMSSPKVMKSLPSLVHSKQSTPKKVSLSPLTEPKGVTPKTSSLRPLVESKATAPKLPCLSPVVSPSNTITEEEEPKSVPTTTKSATTTPKSTSPSSSLLPSKSSITSSTMSKGARFQKSIGHGRDKKKSHEKREDLKSEPNDGSMFQMKSTDSGLVKNGSFINDVLQSSLWLHKKEKKQQRTQKVMKIVLIVMVIFWIVVIVTLVLVFTLAEGKSSNGNNGTWTNILSTSNKFTSQSTSRFIPTTRTTRIIVTSVKETLVTKTSPSSLNQILNASERILTNLLHHP